jgi:hypothetical protein
MTKARKRQRIHRVARGNPSPVTSSPITDDAEKVKSSATITSSTPRRPPTMCLVDWSLLTFIVVAECSNHDCAPSDLQLARQSRISP